jgi:methylated-DNA-[protein]-cysteine S-methyltransferase
MKFDPFTVQTRIDSPLGAMVLAASPLGLVGAWFHDQRHLPDFSAWAVDDRQPVLLQTAAQLAAYFAGGRRDFDLPLDLSAGTAFQQSVWQALLAIPCGQRRSYGGISAAVGKPAAVRAVGAAVGRNPISIIVPCHRVLGADGSLTGYAGGLSRKTALLQLEIPSGSLL